MSIMKYAYFNEKIIPSKEAKLSVASQSVQYGLTAFAGIRGYCINKKIAVFRLKDHFDRLMDAIKIFGVEHTFSWESFTEILEELITKNQVTEDIYIRPFIYLKEDNLRPLFHQKHFYLGIFFVPIADQFISESGLKLMISSWRKFTDISLPTKAKAGGGYINSALASSEALQLGYDEALMTDSNGYIVEGSVANVFLEYRNTILSPPIASDLLEGITMRSIISFLKDLKYTHCYEPIDRSMIYTAQSLLLSGTAVQVKYAESVDGRIIGNEFPPKIYVELKKCFQDVITGNNPRYAHWLYHFPIKGGH